MIQRSRKEQHIQLASTHSPELLQTSHSWKKNLFLPLQFPSAKWQTLIIPPVHTIRERVVFKSLPYTLAHSIFMYPERQAGQFYLILQMRKRNVRIQIIFLRSVCGRAGIVTQVFWLPDLEMVVLASRFPSLDCHSLFHSRHSGVGIGRATDSSRCGSRESSSKASGKWRGSKP